LSKNKLKGSACPTVDFVDRLTPPSLGQTHSPLSADHLPLVGRIREELQEVSRAAERAAELSQKALQTGDDGYWDGAALNLYSFYTGLERILVPALFSPLPSGPSKVLFTNGGGTRCPTVVSPLYRQ